MSRDSLHNAHLQQQFESQHELVLSLFHDKGVEPQTIIDCFRSNNIRLLDELIVLLLSRQSSHHRLLPGYRFNEHESMQILGLNQGYRPFSKQYPIAVLLLQTISTLNSSINPLFYNILHILRSNTLYNPTEYLTAITNSAPRKLLHYLEAKLPFFLPSYTNKLIFVESMYAIFKDPQENLKRWFSGDKSVLDDIVCAYDVPIRAYIDEYQRIVQVLLEDILLTGHFPFFQLLISSLVSSTNPSDLSSTNLSATAIPDLHIPIYQPPSPNSLESPSHHAHNSHHDPHDHPPASLSHRFGDTSALKQRFLDPKFLQRLISSLSNTYDRIQQLSEIISQRPTLSQSQPLLPPAIDSSPPSSLPSPFPPGPSQSQSHSHSLHTTPEFAMLSTNPAGDYISITHLENYLEYCLFKLDNLFSILFLFLQTFPFKILPAESQSILILTLQTNPTLFQISTFSEQQQHILAAIQFEEVVHNLSYLGFNASHFHFPTPSLPPSTSPPTPTNSPSQLQPPTQTQPASAAPHTATFPFWTLTHSSSSHTIRLLPLLNFSELLHYHLATMIFPADSILRMKQAQLNQQPPPPFQQPILYDIHPALLLNCTNFVFHHLHLSRQPTSDLSILPSKLDSSSYTLITPTMSPPQHPQDLTTTPHDHDRPHQPNHQSALSWAIFDVYSISTDLPDLTIKPMLDNAVLQHTRKKQQTWASLGRTGNTTKTPDAGLNLKFYIDHQGEFVEHTHNELLERHQAAVLKFRDRLHSRQIVLHQRRKSLMGALKSVTIPPNLPYSTLHDQMYQAFEDTPNVPSEFLLTPHDLLFFHTNYFSNRSVLRHLVIMCLQGNNVNGLSHIQTYTKRTLNQLSATIQQSLVSYACRFPMINPTTIAYLVENGVLFLSSPKQLNDQQTQQQVNQGSLIHLHRDHSFFQLFLYDVTTLESHVANYTLQNAEYLINYCAKHSRPFCLTKQQFQMILLNMRSTGCLTSNSIIFMYSKLLHVDGKYSYVDAAHALQLLPDPLQLTLPADQSIYRSSYWCAEGDGIFNPPSERNHLEETQIQPRAHNSLLLIPAEFKPFSTKLPSHTVRPSQPSTDLPNTKATPHSLCDLSLPPLTQPNFFLNLKELSEIIAALYSSEYPLIHQHIPFYIRNAAFRELNNTVQAIFQPAVLRYLFHQFHPLHNKYLPRITRSDYNQILVTDYLTPQETVAPTDPTQTATTPSKSKSTTERTDKDNDAEPQRTIAQLNRAKTKVRTGSGGESIREDIILPPLDQVTSVSSNPLFSVIPYRDLPTIIYLLSHGAPSYGCLSYLCRNSTTMSDIHDMVELSTIPNLITLSQQQQRQPLRQQYDFYTDIYWDSDWIGVLRYHIATIMSTVGAPPSAFSSLTPKSRPTHPHTASQQLIELVQPYLRNPSPLHPTQTSLIDLFRSHPQPTAISRPHRSASQGAVDITYNYNSSQLHSAHINHMTQLHTVYQLIQYLEQSNQSAKLSFKMGQILDKFLSSVLPPALESIMQYAIIPLMNHIDFSSDGFDDLPPDPSDTNDRADPMPQSPTTAPPDRNLAHTQTSDPLPQAHISSHTEVQRLIQGLVEQLETQQIDDPLSESQSKRFFLFSGHFLMKNQPSTFFEILRLLLLSNVYVTDLVDENKVGLATYLATTPLWGFFSCFFDNLTFATSSPAEPSLSSAPDPITTSEDSHIPQQQLLLLSAVRSQETDTKDGAAARSNKAPTLIDGPLRITNDSVQFDHASVTIPTRQAIGVLHAGRDDATRPPPSSATNLAANEVNFFASLISPSTTTSNSNYVHYQSNFELVPNLHSFSTILQHNAFLLLQPTSKSMLQHIPSSNPYIKSFWRSAPTLAKTLLHDLPNPKQFYQLAIPRFFLHEFLSYAFPQQLLPPNQQDCRNVANNNYLIAMPIDFEDAHSEGSVGSGYHHVNMDILTVFSHHIPDVSSPNSTFTGNLYLVYEKETFFTFLTNKLIFLAHVAQNYGVLYNTFVHCIRILAATYTPLGNAAFFTPTFQLLLHNIILSYQTSYSIYENALNQLAVSSRMLNSYRITYTSSSSQSMTTSSQTFDSSRQVSSLTSIRYLLQLFTHFSESHPMFSPHTNPSNYLIQSAHLIRFITLLKSPFHSNTLNYCDLIHSKLSHLNMHQLLYSPHLTPNSPPLQLLLSTPIISSTSHPTHLLPHLDLHQGLAPLLDYVIFENIDLFSHLLTLLKQPQSSDQTSSQAPFHSQSSSTPHNSLYHIRDQFNNGLLHQLVLHHSTFPLSSQTTATIQLNSEQRSHVAHISSTEHHSLSTILQCVESLVVDFELDINSPNVFGWTPLHFACMHLNIPMIKLLIVLGADVSAKDIWGRTVIMLLLDDLWLEQQKLVCHRFLSPDPTLETPSEPSSLLKLHQPIKLPHQQSIMHSSLLSPLAPPPARVQYYTEHLQNLPQLHFLPQTLTPTHLQWLNTRSVFPHPQAIIKTSTSPLTAQESDNVQPSQLSQQHKPVSESLCMKDVIQHAFSRDALFSELYLKLILLNNVFVPLNSYQRTSSFRAPAPNPPSDQLDPYNAMIDFLVAAKPRTGNSSSTDRGSDGTKVGPTRGEKYRKQVQSLLIQEYVEKIVHCDQALCPPQQSASSTDALSSDITALTTPAAYELDLQQDKRRAEQDRLHRDVVFEQVSIVVKSNLHPSASSSTPLGQNFQVVDVFDQLLSILQIVLMKQAMAKALLPPTPSTPTNNNPLFNVFEADYIDSLFSEISSILEAETRVW